MPKLIQYQCDIPGCTAVRGAANHWFLVWETFEGFIVIAPFSEDDSAYSGEKLVICGEAHVHEFISANLAKLFPPPLVPSARQEDHSLKQEETKHIQYEDVAETAAKEVISERVILCKNCAKPIKKDGDSVNSGWKHVKSPCYYSCSYDTPEASGMAAPSSSEPLQPYQSLDDVACAHEYDFEGYCIKCGRGKGY